MEFVETSIKQDTDLEDASCAYYSTNPLIRRIYRSRLKYALALAPNLPNMKILDLGTGCGILLPSLVKYGQTYGIDHSEKYLTKAQNLCHKANLSVTLIKGNVLAIPFEEQKFDIIFCLSVLEHIRELDKAATEIKRVLKKNGILIIGLPIERFMVNTLFYLINVKKEVEEVHVSDFKMVKNTFKKHFNLEKSKKMPLNFFPDAFSLYQVLRYRN